jgi:hypothetical protein
LARADARRSASEIKARAAGGSVSSAIFGSGGGACADATSANVRTPIADAETTAARENRTSQLNG